MDENLQSGTNTFLKKSICIISLSPIAQDARVLRQIQYLSLLYDLTVIGYGPPHPSYADTSIKWIQLDQHVNSEIPNLRTALWNLDFKNLNLSHHIAKRIWRNTNKVLLSLGNIFPKAHELWYRRQAYCLEAIRHAINARCHAYHANDWNTLPIAARAARRNHAVLVLDLHEYAPLQYNEDTSSGKQKRLINYALHKYLPQVDTAITVAEPLAQRYSAEYGFQPFCDHGCTG